LLRSFCYFWITLLRGWTQNLSHFKEFLYIFFLFWASLHKINLAIFSRNLLLRIFCLHRTWKFFENLLLFARLKLGLLGSKYYLNTITCVIQAIQLHSTFISVRAFFKSLKRFFWTHLEIVSCFYFKILTFGNYEKEIRFASIIRSCKNSTFFYPAQNL
jgi:hypothetical protein